MIHGNGDHAGLCKLKGNSVLLSVGCDLELRVCFKVHWPGIPWFRLSLENRTLPAWVIRWMSLRGSTSESERRWREPGKSPTSQACNLRWVSTKASLDRVVEVIPERPSNPVALPERSIVIQQMLPQSANLADLTWESSLQCTDGQIRANFETARLPDCFYNSLPE